MRNMNSGTGVTYRNTLTFRSILHLYEPNVEDPQLIWQLLFNRVLLDPAKDGVCKGTGDDGLKGGAGAEDRAGPFCQKVSLALGILGKSRNPGIKMLSGCRLILRRHLRKGERTEKLMRNFKNRYEYQCDMTRQNDQ